MPEAKQVFYLHNVVRRRHTRLKRMQSVGRHRFKQYVGDVRVTRNRPRPVLQSFIEKHLEELKKMQEEGVMEVKTASGQLIDLNTLSAAPAPAPKPQPKPPMDTAANDKNQGSPKPHYPEGKGVDEVVDPPSVTTDGLPEGVEPESHDPESDPSDPYTSKKKSRRSGRKS